MFFFPFLKPQLQLQAIAKLIQGLSQEWLHKTSNIGSRHQRMNKIWKDVIEGKSIPGSGHGMQKGREVSENTVQVEKTKQIENGRCTAKLGTRG